MLRPTPWRMLLEFHLIDFAFMSAEHDVSAKPLSRKVPTKRHPVAYKLSRWDASDSHLISLTLLHVHSSRRALAHCILLHFPSLPPYNNILVFLFISILSFLINLSAFLLYNLRPRHSPVSMNSLPECCSFAGRFYRLTKEQHAGFLNCWYLLGLFPPGFFIPAVIPCYTFSSYWNQKALIPYRLWDFGILFLQSYRVFGK